MKHSTVFIRAKLAQILIDAVLVVLSLFLSYALAEQTVDFSGKRLSWLWYTLPIFLIVKLSANYFLGIYRQLWRYFSTADVWNLFKAVSVANLVSFLVLEMLDWPLPGRALLVLDWILCMNLFSAARLLRRFGAMRQQKKDTASLRQKRALLYGAGEGGDSLARRIQGDPYAKILPVGFIDDDPEKSGASLHGVRVFGGLERMEDLIGELAVDEVIITTPLIPKEKVETVLKIARARAIEAKTVPSLYEMLEGGFHAPFVRDIEAEDFLGRKRVVPDQTFLKTAFPGKRFLVTGCCGSIGKELVGQIARFGPEKIIALDINETGIFWLDHDLSKILPREQYALFICDVRNPERLQKIIDEEKPSIIYHAAAYKHVPLSQANPSEYVLTNVYGTQNLIRVAKSRSFVKKFCLISTDKAVNPTSIMGATKRLAEMLVEREALGTEDKKITFVRFGNVLGSRGSIVPVFKEMIAKGGPIMVTHHDVERYFMGIHEAVSLVLQAPFFVGNGSGFVLDMGEPIKIRKLAKLAIRLSGLDEGSVEIKYIGLRPGEKLTEELYDPVHETLRGTSFEKINVIADRKSLSFPHDEQLQGAIALAHEGNDEEVRLFLKKIFPDLAVS